MLLPPYNRTGISAGSNRHTVREPPPPKDMGKATANATHKPFILLDGAIAEAQGSKNKSPNCGKEYGFSPLMFVTATIKAITKSKGKGK